ncbi:alpha/beta hydrolase [Uruburuella testudinis]|uniref:Alpha/beta hydrolase n=1 Tax=Uruburuella testudinis TaxID=1282863 RepID=A0ABY4DUM2_9NEIS|nr:alpha/beta hydrolase [Uruburuella testudinis]UOO81699.1 alpha/beta hydrolase [Uruburuella testudinis]
MHIKNKIKRSYCALSAVLLAVLPVSAYAEPAVPSWQSCHRAEFKSWFTADNPAEPSLQCAWLGVPLSYQADDAAAPAREVKLALTRLPAKAAKGSIVFIAGGPGESGINPNVAASAATRHLLREYDLIGYAPRGVAPSVPAIACPLPEGAPADDGKAFVDACVKGTGADTLKYLSTREAVEDVESIRRALAVSKLNLIGYSYGTKVAALYAERYPAHLRAAVLDGVVDLAEDFTAQRMAQEQGYQQTFERFAEWCAENRRHCPLAAAPDQAVSRLHTLLARLDQAPLRDQKGETIDADALIGLMGDNMLWQEDWPDLAQALIGLQQGRSGGYNRLKYRAEPAGDEDALTVINCADAALQLPRQQELQRLRQIDAASRFDNYRVKSDEALLEPCSYWPHPGTDTAHTPQPDSKLPKLLFVAQTHDGTTPYRNAEKMAKAFNSHLLTRNGNGHTLALQGLSACVDKQVAAYLRHPAAFKQTQLCGSE